MRGSIAFGFPSATSKARSICPCNRLVNGDERKVQRKFQIIVPYYLYVPERRVWRYIKIRVHASVILAVAGSKGLLVSCPDPRYTAVPDQFKDVQVIFRKSRQVRAKDY
jgi:hypothetical protein